jgi:hypothetical protein
MDLELILEEQGLTGLVAHTLFTMAEERDAFETSSTGKMNDFEDPISIPNPSTPGTKNDLTPPDGTLSIPGPRLWAMMVLVAVFITLGAVETRRRYLRMK